MKGGPLYTYLGRLRNGSRVIFRAEYMTLSARLASRPRLPRKRDATRLQALQPAKGGIYAHNALDVLLTK